MRQRKAATPLWQAAKARKLFKSHHAISHTESATILCIEQTWQWHRATFAAAPVCIRLDASLKQLTRHECGLVFPRSVAMLHQKGASGGALSSPCFSRIVWKADTASLCEAPLPFDHKGNSITTLHSSHAHSQMLMGELHSTTTASSLVL